MRTEYEQSVYESARDSALAERDQPKFVPTSYTARTSDGWELTFTASECGDGVWFNFKIGPMSGCTLLTSKEIESLCYAAGEAELEIPR